MNSLLTFLQKSTIKIAILFPIFIAFAFSSNAQNNALNFDGVDDFITIGSPSGIYASGLSYTKEAWVLFGGANVIGVENIISSKDAFWIEGGKIHAGNNFDGTTPDLVDPNDFTVGHWEHVALTYDFGTTTMKLYRNGILVASTTLANASAAGQNFIGRYDDGSPEFYSWKGNMDEVKIYNIALTQAQIQADMVGTSIAVPASIKAYYDFDFGSGVTLTDNSPNGNHGTLNNFALLGVASNWVTSYALVIPAANTASGVNSTSFNANWTAPAVGTGNNYIVDISTASDFSLPITGSPFTVAFGTNTLTVTGLTASTAYYYRVRLENASFAGQAAYSITVITTTLSPLPVNLLNFNVTKGVGMNQLQWATATELSSKLFEVQRSTDGINFTVLSVISSAGNSSNIKSYQFNDKINNFAAPFYYYRLKMVDINSSFKFSNVIMVKSAGSVDITVYPNPSQDKVIINVTDKVLLNTTVSLSELSGKLLQNVLINQTSTSINIINYSKGIYILRFINGQSIKFVKD